MAERKGRQTPTQSVILPYKNTYGLETVKLYNSCGNMAMPWQELLISDIEAVNDDGLWVHTKFGYSVPRQNGKNEIITMREMSGLVRGERILHTAHLASTSHAAWERLMDRLTKAGIEITSSYRARGCEHIDVAGGGHIAFRTRTSSGGLGESYDLLVIDEAQMYQDSHESALKYVIAASKNPQTILCGTPPTPESTGTVFQKLRQNTLAGETSNTGWAEWSVDQEVSVRNKDAWYETNPSLGYHLRERTILDEIGTDDVDFLIQRLGYWISYNLKSAISRAEWEELKAVKLPKLKTKLFVGIKYGKDGNNVAMSIAAKTFEGQVFVEGIDCKEIRQGNNWIVNFLSEADVEKVAVDGANGQQLLASEMKNAGLKLPIMPTVKEIIVANSTFEQALYAETICHMNQPSLTQAVSNCEKRAIGSSGGFGYKSIKDGVDIALMDSMIIAHWLAHEAKETKHKQRIGY